jgi:RNA polymerase sigma factor (TIGR02999 family)
LKIAPRRGLIHAVAEDVQPGTLDHLLRGTGDDSWRELLTTLYADLHLLAQSYLREERPDHTLQPTALVHEAYLRLRRERTSDWDDRGGLLAACAQAMRRILVDHERSRRRLKRGGGWRRLRIDVAGAVAGERAVDLLALDSALDRLAAVDPVRASIVELRFFGGLTTPQIALHLGLSAPTVNRYWHLARAWLHRELRPPG